MKKIIFIFLIPLAFISLNTEAQVQQAWGPDNNDETFTNPITWGDWSYPDITRVEDDFYFTSTSIWYCKVISIVLSKFGSYTHCVNVLRVV